MLCTLLQLLTYHRTHFTALVSTLLETVGRTCRLRNFVDDELCINFLLISGIQSNVSPREEVSNIS